MRTFGGAKFGYCSTGKEKIANAPVRQRIIASTQAKIGRSIKKLAMQREPRYDLFYL
ncbi:hypothetical protein AB3M74_15855 [Serratia ureilytica]|uniref:hypothetical protein n=1 Tax=Serratia ureilytica TaxID=300181 RepID=UPI0034DC2443